MADVTPVLRPSCAYSMLSLPEKVIWFDAEPGDRQGASVRVRVSDGLLGRLLPAARVMRTRDRRFATRHLSEPSSHDVRWTI